MAWEQYFVYDVFWYGRSPVLYTNKNSLGHDIIFDMHENDIPNGTSN